MCREEQLVTASHDECEPPTITSVLRKLHSGLLPEQLSQEEIALLTRDEILLREKSLDELTKLSQELGLY